MKPPLYIISPEQTQAYRTVREYMAQALRQHNLSPTLWSMLCLVQDARDGIRQVEIAEKLRVKPPLVTAMTRQLQRSGFVQSVRNQFDARAKLLAITPEGKKQMRLIESSLHDQLQPLLKGLSEAELVSYHKVLTTIIANSSQS